MEFLGKESKISERQDRLTTTEKFRSIQGRKELKQRSTDNTFRGNPTIALHPAIPVPDLQITVEDYQADVDRVE